MALCSHGNGIACGECADASSIIADAIAALGPAWMHGGVSLADGIRRKTAAMERLSTPMRKRAGATLTIERDDGTTETTTYGGDR